MKLFSKIRKIFTSPLALFIPLYVWLLIDTLNGLVVRFVDLPLTISNIFKAVVLLLALLAIRNKKHLYIALAAFAVIGIATVAHLFNPLSAGISTFTLVYEDLLAGIKLVGPIIFTLAFLSAIPALKEKHGKHLRMILLFNLGIIAVNLILSVVGVGYSQYKGDIGARGLFLSGNELALAFFTLASTIVYLRRNLKSYVFVPVIAVVILCALIVGTKVAVLGTLLVIGFVALFLRYDPVAKALNKKRLTKKHFVWLGTLFVLAIIGLFAIWKIPYTHEAIARWSAMIDMSNNFLSGILSHRDTLAASALAYIQNHFTWKDYLFGIGFDNISRAMSMYAPFRYGISELDLVDLFMYIGGLSVLYYGLWIYMMVKMISRKPITSSAIFGVFFNMSLLVISTISGHTIFSAVNAPFWGVINVIGLQGISMKLGLDNLLRKLARTKIIYVLPAAIFIAIDALSASLRASSTPTITLSLVFKALAVVCLIPLLKRKQLCYMIFLAIGACVLTTIHLLNPFTVTSGVRAVVLNDLQLMFKLLLPLVYAFALFELGKNTKAKQFRLLLLFIFGLNFALILGNELIGVLQLSRINGLTSITSISAQKGLLFSWNEFSIGYVTIGSYLLYQLRNKNPVLLIAFAVLLLFGTFMVYKKVAIFGTAFFTAFTFVLLRYDFWFKCIHRKWKEHKDYWIWVTALVIVLSGVVVLGIKTFDLSKLAPAYTGQYDRVTYAIEEIKQGDWDPALEALFSGRNRFSESASKAIKNDFTVSDHLFGIGFRNINDAVGKYQPGHPGITEIDPIDLYMAIGVFGVLYYLAWFAWILWLATRLKSSPYMGYILCLNLFLVAASATSGHIVYSGLNGAFFGILNGVALAINYHQNVKDRHNLVILTGMGKGGVRGWLDSIATYLKPRYQERFKVIRTHREVHQPIINVVVFAVALVKICWNGFVHLSETTVYHVNVEQGGSFVRAAIAARTAGLLPKARIVLHIHGARFFEYTDKLSKSAKGRKLFHLLFETPKIKAVISLTESRKTEFDELMKKWNIKTAFHHFVVPNPIDFHALKSSKKDEYRGALELLYVGRLVEQKNIITIIKAIKKLVNSGIQNIHLTLVGDGEARSTLEAFVAENKLQQFVTFTGWIDHSKLSEYYTKANVFVLPSIFESFGIVALEAYANSLPIIASKTGGLKDLVDEGINGFKVEPTDVAGFANAIKEFIDKPALIARIGRANYNKAQEYDLPKVGRLLTSIYEEVLKPEAPRLLLIASSGGHLNQLMMLGDWWGNYNRMFVAYDKIDARTLLKDEPHALSKYTSIRNPLHVFATAWLAFKVIKKYRPHLIFSTGEGLCVPFFYVGKFIFGSKTVLLDSLSKTHPSLSAYLSYFILDDLLTQWPEVTKKWKKFKYKGRVI